MAVEFWSVQMDGSTKYVGRVEDGRIVEGGERLRRILDNDALADEANGHPLDDEDYLVRRYSGISFVARKAD